LEGLFAVFLANKIKCDHVFVDQPISVSGQRLRYPDIAVARDEQLTGFCDLKTGMGWDRKGLRALCRRHCQWLQKARGKIAGLNEKEGLDKRRRSYKVSERATYSVVILHEHNINTEVLKDQISTVKKQSGRDLDVFILTRGGHPNEYGIDAGKLRRAIHLRHGEIRALVNRLSR
jgi:hypothetical protein